VRQFALTTAAGGINRLRDKGGASKDSLYDLVNGYVTQTNSIKPRPGTRLAYSLPEGTKGLAAFQDKLHVFSSEPVVSSDPMVVVNILRHPAPGSTMPLKEIHFAAPFLGFLYVAAEWLNGEVYHYWLQSATAWLPNTSYSIGAIVAPTVPNGYYYRASRIGPAGIAWAPNVARTIGDVVEPTVTNGYEYTVIETYGATPRSGATEPVWPKQDGATIAEDTEGGVPSGPTTPTTPTTTVPPEVEDRYGTGVNANRQVGGTGQVLQ
jgi:hypothetical protein